MAVANEQAQPEATYRPVRASNAYEAVVQRLEEEVLSGRLQPGARLPAMAELARSLSVSIPVVREAIMSLRARGLLDVRHGSGTYVCEPPPPAPRQPLALPAPATAGDMLALLDVRLPLEVRAVELAAAMRHGSDLEPLEAAVTAMARAHQAGDLQGFGDADKAFHLGLAALSGNPYLPALLEPILDLMAAACSLPGAAGRVPPRAPGILHHRALVAALRDGNHDMAALVIRQHLQSSATAFGGPAATAFGGPFARSAMTTAPAVDSRGQREPEAVGSRPPGPSR